MSYLGGGRNFLGHNGALTERQFEGEYSYVTCGLHGWAECVRTRAKRV